MKGVFGTQHLVCPCRKYVARVNELYEGKKSKTCPHCGTGSDQFTVYDPSARYVPPEVKR